MKTFHVENKKAGVKSSPSTDVLAEHQFKIFLVILLQKLFGSAILQSTKSDASHHQLTYTIGKFSSNTPLTSLYPIDTAF